MYYNNHNQLKTFFFMLQLICILLQLIVTIDLYIKNCF